MIVRPNGTIEWLLDGVPHRIDGPAYIEPDGPELWFFNGILHCPHGPAIVYPNGHMEWWLFGLRHREDGPSIITERGYKSWHLNNERLDKSDFTTYETIERMQAWDLFTIEELLRMK